MADAFENIIQHSYTDKEVIIRPLNVVHDSSQNYFEAKYIFKISQFYNKYLRSYLYGKYGIDYAFDTEVGDNYFDMTDLSVIDDKTIALKGTYVALTKLLAKLDSSNVKYSVVSLTNKKKTKNYLNENGSFSPDFKQEGYDDYVTQFYENNMYATFNMDLSCYILTIHDES